jgi:hypothetical protein
VAVGQNKPKAHINVRRRELSSKRLARRSALATLVVALGCGVVGIITTTVWFETAVLLAISTGLAYIVFATRESTEAMTDITNAIDRASRTTSEALMEVAAARGKLTPIPVPDHVFRHASHALGSRPGKGGWQRVCLYAPVGVWMESEPKDQWLVDLVKALSSGQVKQCWGVYGLPPKTEAAAWHAHADPRLRMFISADHTQLHYLPAEDARHPGAARGQGIILLESAGEPTEYTTIFLFIGDNSESRGGFMIDEDQVIGKTIAKWFDSQVFSGCSANYLLRPLQEYKDQSPAAYMEAKLAEISSRYPKARAAQRTAIVSGGLSR